MTNPNNLLISLNAIFTSLIACSFFLTLLGEKDELETHAFNNALKNSIVIVTLSLIGYGFYSILIGKTSISVNIIFFTIESLAVLSLLFYFLELKGISFAIKIKNKLFTNILIYISIAISIFSTISILIKPKFFENPTGLIRYDELILYVNVIALAFIITLFPNDKKKLSREQYKKEQKNLDKKFNIFLVVFLVFWIGVIAYAFYKKTH